MKNWIKGLLLVTMLAIFMVGCGGTETAETEATTEAAKTEAAKTEATTEAATTEEAKTEETTAGGMTGTINVVSREEGSGTRGAFVELTGVEEDKTDNTYSEATIQNSTDAVMSTVATDPAAIGYISLGSLNDTVKALKVEDVEASVEDIKNGTYKIARPFNICYKDGELSEVAQDFVDFIMSKEGQDIVAGEKYITVDDAAPAYEQKEGLSAQLTVGGSTSVTPVMEKLAEAYRALNPEVEINIESTGSTAGVTGAVDGMLDIGMVSRDLKDEEKAQLKDQVIAMDGIAVIVNTENTVETISMDQIKAVFTGETTNWEDVK